MAIEAHTPLEGVDSGKGGRPHPNTPQENSCENCGNKTEQLFHLRYSNPDNSLDKIKEGWICRPCSYLVNHEQKYVAGEYTTTLTTLATACYTTKNWGFFDATAVTYAERISNDTFLYNTNGKIGLTILIFPPPKKGEKKKKPYLFIEETGKRYTLDGKLWGLKQVAYPMPSKQKVEEFVRGEYQPRPIKSILKDVHERINTLFDFSQERDIHLWLIFIAQSYLKPILNSFFFAGVDATKGGGKTTLLEIMASLSRHGFLGGDVSAASLPRMVEELDLALFLDELDQRVGKTGEQDSVNIIRKGQRRGNPYVRMNKDTMMPESFDVAGTHAFSYRSDLEDAFLSRAVQVHTAESRDKRLPVLNFYKEALLSDLRDELFFWGVANIPSCYNLLQETEENLRREMDIVASCSKCSSQSEVRESLYNAVTKDYTKDELKILDQLNGRNIELAFILLQIARLLKLDITPIIGAAMQEKEEEELHGGTFYKEALCDLLKLQYESLGSEWLCGEESETAGCKFTIKSAVYTALSKELKEQEVKTIGTKRFNSLLRDIGFMQGVSMKSQRPPQLSPRPCLIFTPEILDSLSIDEPKQTEEAL